LNEVGLPKTIEYGWVKQFHCTLLREIRVMKLLRKTQVSISVAYFFAVGTEAYFFNRIGWQAG
jgi:hypothetical protein